MNEVDADRYDLIFMDIQMPKMDGYMTTREIRTLKNNKKANIPIVAMTANVLKNAFQKPAWENSFWKFCSPTNWAGLKGV